MNPERLSSVAPERLAHNVIDVWGQAGAAWLERLPALLSEISARWSLALEWPFAGLSYNYVAPATLHNGTRAVLKVGVPDKERLAETAALPHYGGGMVRLLEADPGNGALLLERLEPGAPLNTLTESGRDDEATSIAAGIMLALWRPVPNGLAVPGVGEWAAGLSRLRERYGGTTGPLPEDLVAAAERDFAALGTSAPAAMLHGDFHHGNILSAARKPWLAIDPKGLTGPRGYDAGNFLRSNLETLPDPRRALNRRLDILSVELGMPRDELRRWSLAQAVLSAWWSIEDHGDGWQGTIATARMLAELRD